MFARSLKVAIAGVRSLTVAKRPPAGARREHMPHKGDQARGRHDLQQMVDKRTKHDLKTLLDRGVVS